uniref:Uncharacterized protein n=1 Tax=Arundo donax TaxID=35708 RepID=A0A0A9FEM8_ARUDO
MMVVVLVDPVRLPWSVVLLSGLIK